MITIYTEAIPRFPFFFFFFGYSLSLSPIPALRYFRVPRRKDPSFAGNYDDPEAPSFGLALKLVAFLSMVSDTES